MEPDVPGHVEELFAAALELSAADREAFLDRACAGNPGLRADVGSLIEWHQRAEAEAAGGWTPVSREAESLSALVRARSLAAGRFGPFAVEVCVGEGATGIVYRALDTRTDRTVALKVASARTMLDPEGRRRFEKAAAASQRLDHPHIARVFEADVEQGVPYLAMEYVDGHTLAGKLSLVNALRTARQIADALSAAHEHGIVHRDLKPANIMIGRDGAVKVLDFGLCHAVAGVESIAQTQTGLLLGTPGYMAPELVRGASPSPQTDVFSLGAVLYEMLSGAPAFHGETSMATISSVLHVNPGRPAGVPAAIVRLVERCLEKDPANRPRGAAEVSASLARLERQVSSGRIRVRPVWDVLRWRASHFRPRTLAAGAAAALLLCAAAAAAMFLLRAPPHFAALTPVTSDGTRLNTEPAISPDRKWVAFASDRSGEGNLDLWTVAASGGAPRRLTRNEINTRQPAFSPDGRTLLFRSDRDGGGIYKTSVDAGADLPTASLVAAHGLRPKFSPDGQTVVYWSGIDGSGDNMAMGASRIFVVPAKGGPARQLCPDFNSAAYPIWSPDSKSILFAGRKISPPTDLDPLVWMTKVETCAPIPVGGWADYASNNTDLAAMPERWLPGGRLLFRIPTNTATSLLELRFTPATGRIVERAKRLGLPVEGGNMISVLDESTIAMALLHNRTALWTLPLDSSGGAGPPAPILECPGPFCIPALTPDGATLFYSRSQNGWEFQLRDFGKPAETLVAGPEPSSPWPFLAGPQLDMLYTQPNPHLPGKFTLYSVSRTTGTRATLCPVCPEPWDVSPTGRWLLGSSGFVQRTVALVDLATQRRTELLTHPQWNLYRASFSPDESSVLFTAKLGSYRSQILVADFRDGRCPPSAGWVPISDDTEYNGPAHWSPDGTRIYFTSERDGHRCFYIRPWDRKRHVPAGPITVLRHFHAEAESPGRIPQSLFGFAVGRDKIVFPVGRQDGDIWLVN